MKIEAAGDKGRRAKGKTMEVRIEGKKLVITIDMEAPVPSKTGKTTIIASSHGNQKTAIMIEGEPLQVGVNAFAVRKQP